MQADSLISLVSLRILFPNTPLEVSPSLWAKGDASYMEKEQKPPLVTFKLAEDQPELVTIWSFHFPVRNHMYTCG